MLEAPRNIIQFSPACLIEVPLTFPVTFCLLPGRLFRGIMTRAERRHRFCTILLVNEDF